jgi:hypothetical protein
MSTLKLVVLINTDHDDFAQWRAEYGANNLVAGQIERVRDELDRGRTHGKLNDRNGRPSIDWDLIEVDPAGCPVSVPHTREVCGHPHCREAS